MNAPFAVDSRVSNEDPAAAEITGDPVCLVVSIVSRRGQATVLERVGKETLPAMVGCIDRDFARIEKAKSNAFLDLGRGANYGEGTGSGRRAPKIRTFF
jgi:hypothetical protein